MPDSHRLGRANDDSPNACAERMHTTHPVAREQSSVPSPQKGIAPKPVPTMFFFVSFVTFVVKVFLRISFAPFTELSDFSHPTTH